LRITISRLATRKWYGQAREDKGKLFTQKARMQNLLNSFLLICAAMGSLALGVLLAYWTCKVAFATLKMHARSFAASPRIKAETARVS
jgi:hypothetical protein